MRLLTGMLLKIPIPHFLELFDETVNEIKPYIANANEGHDQSLNAYYHPEFVNAIKKHFAKERTILVMYDEWQPITAG